MKRSLLALCVPALLTLSALAPAQTPPLPAATVLQQGLEKAGKEKKVVFLAFHATWCGWCHKLDDFLKMDAIKPIADKHLEIVWIDVMENGDAKKAQFENPGWESIVAKFKAEEAGLPSFYILNKDGETIASSIRPKDKGGNTGYPGEPDEIAHFLGMMKAAGCTDTELTTLKTKLEEIAKTLKH